MLETHSETDRTARSAEAPAPAARRRPPFGVKVVIVLLVLDFVVSTIAGIAVPFAWSAIPAELQLQAAFSTSLAVVMGIASLVMAVGLLKLKRWAWYGVMILTGISLLLAIWQYFRGAEPYADLLLNAVLTFYLNQREVQNLFVADRASEPLR